MRSPPWPPSPDTKGRAHRRRLLAEDFPHDDHRCRKPSLPARVLDPRRRSRRSAGPIATRAAVLGGRSFPPTDVRPRGKGASPKPGRAPSSNYPSKAKDAQDARGYATAQGEEFYTASSAELLGQKVIAEQ